MPASVNCRDLDADALSVLRLAQDAFAQQFNSNATHAAFAPGRVNLIGEHTDYNEGFVLPMALPNVTVVVGAANNSDDIRLFTTAPDVQKPFLVTCKAPSSGSSLEPGSPSWANYVKGVIAHYPGEVRGFDMAIATNVPLGGGLSSSASLEVATFTFLESLFPVQVSDKDKALVCQKAEHTFAGMPCGIMDQFISTMGLEGHALLIDCRSMEGKRVKLQLQDQSIVVINSNVKHELTGSEYSSRRRNCEEAAAALGVPSLRHATMSLLESKKQALDELTYRRARHVISEISRTQEADVALESGNLKRFGQLMVDSHNSLRDDYEVSCPELDQLVEIAMSVTQVYGSRMTGGGFGGCTVTLVDNSSVTELIDRVKKNYKGSATCLICKASNGARIIEL